ncbi:MAG: restriction endonuclease subunit S [Erythrobacter sp.]|nr:restriction endonuclease subunit S [Erythrobacter sp.]
MSHLRDLVSSLCPAGVESVALGDLGSITRGRRFVKADMVESGSPCIHYGELYTKYGTWATKAYSYLEPALASRLRVAKPGDVIFVSTGETIEDIGKAVAWLGGEDIVIHDALYAFRSDLDPKYVAYFSQTREFHAQIRRNISSSKVSAISPENLAKVRIPAPPLEIQHEVVRVLDRLAELEANLRLELEAELVARRLQYEHYRDRLLTFEELA